MKKAMFLILLVLILFSSCSIHLYQLNTYTIDYSKYTEKNFFITEASAVSFDYMPIGSITVESISGVYSQKTNEYDFSDVEKSANVEDAFQKLYEVAIKKGANGIINVKMNFTSAYTVEHTYFPSRWLVSGMMIVK